MVHGFGVGVLDPLSPQLLAPNSIVSLRFGRFGLVSLKNRREKICAPRNPVDRAPTGPVTGQPGARAGQPGARPGANRAPTGRKPGQNPVNRAVDRAGRSRAWSTGRQPGATSTNHRHPLRRRQAPPPSPNHRETSPRPHNLRRNRKGIDTSHHRLTTATTAKLL